MIIAQVNGGLGDRLYQLQGYYNYCKNNNIQLIYLFNKRKERCNDFNYYFDTSRFDCDIRNVEYDCWRYQFNEVELDLKISNGVNSDRLQDNDFHLFAKDHNVQIFWGNRKCPLPYDEKVNIFDLISPSEYIESKVGEYMKDNEWTSENKPIGMHIRRTDHWKVIQESPIWLFLDKIDELISIDSGVKIFLCTDDELLKDSLIKNYPNNIFSRIGLPARKTDGGFENGIIDLFLLSRCSKIYGCDSGFSCMARDFGKIELQKITKIGK